MPNEKSEIPDDITAVSHGTPRFAFFQHISLALMDTLSGGLEFMLKECEIPSSIMLYVFL